MSSIPARHSSRVSTLGLAWTLVRTDFKARYHGTIGGFVWALLKPMLMFAVLVAVFSFIFHADPHYRLKLLIGLFLWDFFAESTKTGLGSLHAKGYLLSKAKFPTWILVATSISNPLITLAVFWTSMIAYLVLSGRPVSIVGGLTFFAYLICFALIAVGISLATSVLFLRYRDLNQVWEVVTQAGFFLAPIVWPIGTVPERYHFLLYLWPPTPVIEFSRSVLLFGTFPTLKAHLYLAFEVIVILAVGTYVFRALSPRAAEYL